MQDIIIIGAGVIGSFVARELAKYDAKILVLEKENDVGNVTSMANSAIVHSGYDPIPGTLKAKFNVLGCNLFKSTCQELDVKYFQTGSLTVATEEKHLEVLNSLLKRAKENHVEARLLQVEETKKLVPHLADNIKGALYCPSAGIVDPFNLVVHAMENAIDNGVELLLNQEVIKIEKISNGYEVFTHDKSYKAKLIINASGLNGDIISDMVTPHHFEIRPRKGEYYVLDHFDETFLQMPIFPLPSEKGKGVLMTPTSSKNYLVGPSSEFVDEKNDFSTDSLTLEQVKIQASTLIKDIPFNKTIRVFAGNRPTPSTHDFVIEEVNEHFINAVGIESPGLASSPAIGKFIADDLVANKWHLSKKPIYNPNVKKYIRMQELSLKEKQEMIKQNKLYGQIICKCEYVSKQEMLDVLNRSCPPHSIKAMKKRVRAGFGRCQGSMCQPLVAKLLADFYHIPLNKVVYDKSDSFVVKEETKVGK